MFVAMMETANCVFYAVHFTQSMRLQLVQESLHFFWRNGREQILRHCLRALGGVCRLTKATPSAKRNTAGISECYLQAGSNSNKG